MPGDDTNSTARGRTIDWAALVRKIQGKDRTKPEVAYEFSNGRKFDNTDAAPGGPYGDAAEPD